MTEAQLKQGQPADVSAQEITSFTTMVDEEPSRRNREANLRSEINRLLTMPVNTRRTLQACTDAIVNNLNVVFARIWTLKRGERILRLQASSGLYTGLHGKYSRVPVGHLKIGLIAEKRVPYLTNSALGDPRIEDQEWVRRERIAAFAGYPLVVDDRVVGVIAMFARYPIEPETLETIGSIAGIVAQGIERKRSEKELRRAIEAYNEAVLEERMRIAREMHDGLLQNVTGIALQLSAVLPRVRSAPEEAAAILQRILELTERTSTEARLAVVGMRHITDSGDVVKVLRSTVEQGLEESGLSVSVKVRGRTHVVSPPVCEAIGSIIQHAITNVVRHAKATRVRLAVQFGVRKMRICIRDDGQGFVSHPVTVGNDHFGLIGMRERAKRIGAEIYLRSVLGRGTTVTLLVPYSIK